MHGACPVRIWGDLAVLNCCMFLRIFVIERSEHFASLAICDVVSVFLLCIIWAIIVCCQDLRFRAILLCLICWWYLGCRLRYQLRWHPGSYSRCIFSTVTVQLIQTHLRPVPHVSVYEQKMVFVSNHIQVVCLGTLGFKNKFVCDGHGRRIPSNKTGGASFCDHG